MVRSLRFLPLILVLATSAFAGDGPAYYGRDFYSHKLSGPELKEALFSILSGAHQAVPGDFDQLPPSCTESRCYRHTAIGYKAARVFLFGEFYLVKQNSVYGVKDVYCDRVVFADEFRGAKPGPNLIPDANTMNAEHSWPQSHFTKSFPNEDQKSDIHHLFPTDSTLNSKRSSLDFGNVSSDSEKLECKDSRLGFPKEGGKELVFEPPTPHKGNVARAIFYFSTRYKMNIDASEEATLKEWHRLDPVDTEEKARNERIFALQRNRNPFVDFPELVDRISDF
jgi:deoxyribonuclease-1